MYEPTTQWIWKRFHPLQPCLPSSVDPQELTYLEDERCYIIPDGVRPVLKTFRIEVSQTWADMLQTSSNVPLTTTVHSLCICVCICVFRCCSGVCETWSVWSCSRWHDPWSGWSVPENSWNLRRSRTSKFTRTLKNWSASLMWWVSAANGDIGDCTLDQYRPKALAQPSLNLFGRSSGDMENITLPVPLSSLCI